MSIKSAYSIKFCPKGFRVTILIGIPFDDSEIATDRVPLRYINGEIAICGQTLCRDWGYTQSQKEWVINEFRLTPEWEKYRFQIEELGAFPSPDLAVSIAIETTGYYRRLLALIADCYDRSVAYNSVVQLS